MKARSRDYQIFIKEPSKLLELIPDPTGSGVLVRDHKVPSSSKELVGLLVASRSEGRLTGSLWTTRCRLDRQQLEKKMLMMLGLEVRSLQDESHGNQRSGFELRWRRFLKQAWTTLA
ncbi:unnamed protein product [Protopolystoma xenopodis]|uniref:Uncharacterized protein n=1 Tax=Protopolystoma xenopodis TaxID=117903 RepID=A0A3S5A168_9PLAT|nr:unnamed protein product [Protopolystoma xenopodis]